MWREYRKRTPGAPARKSQLCSTAVVKKRTPGAPAQKSQLCSAAVVKVQKGLPNKAGFGLGRENAYFRIGLVLAILRVVFPDLGFRKISFSIRGLFSIRKKGSTADKRGGGSTGGMSFPNRPRYHGHCQTLHIQAQVALNANSHPLSVPNGHQNQCPNCAQNFRCSSTAMLSNSQDQAILRLWLGSSGDSDPEIRTRSDSSTICSTSPEDNADLFPLPR